MGVPAGWAHTFRTVFSNMMVVVALRIVLSLFLGRLAELVPPIPTTKRTSRFSGCTSPFSFSSASWRFVAQWQSSVVSVTVRVRRNPEPSKGSPAKFKAAAQGAAASHRHAHPWTLLLRGMLLMGPNNRPNHTRWAATLPSLTGGTWLSFQRVPRTRTPTRWPSRHSHIPQTFKARFFCRRLYDFWAHDPYHQQYNAPTPATRSEPTQHQQTKIFSVRSTQHAAPFPF